MKFKNWTPSELIQWLALLPSSPIMNAHNKVKISGEICVDNSEPKRKEASMYGCEPCNTCMYGLDDGKIRTSCLACKWAYSESNKAFEHKADLYVKEEQHETNKAE